MSARWLTYDEYLELPVGFTEEPCGCEAACEWRDCTRRCPGCGAPHFGSYKADEDDINRVYVCHGNELTGQPPCGTKFRPPEPDYDGVSYSLEWKARKVVEAFIRRFA